MRQENWAADRIAGSNHTAEARLGGSILNRGSPLLFGCVENQRGVGPTPAQFVAQTSAFRAQTLNECAVIQLGMDAERVVRVFASFHDALCGRPFSPCRV
jgi:hypothetical protein